MLQKRKIVAWSSATEATYRLEDFPSIRTKMAQKRSAIEELLEALVRNGKIEKKGESL